MTFYTTPEQYTPGVWYKGTGAWGAGTWYQSPDGSVNHATKTTHTDPALTGGQVIPMPGDGGKSPVTSPQSPPFQNVPEYTPSQTSARAQLANTLGHYGLASLADFAWQEYLKNIPIDQIMLDVRQTPEYKHRFPAMDNLSQAGHAMNETQYINYEDSVKQIMQAAGLPSGFYDQPDDFTQFLTNNVSATEVQSRVDIAKQAVYNSDPATLQALHDYYGLNTGGNPIGDATAYFLDPERALPAIQKRMISAQEAGAAARAGYQGLTQSQAENLATLGVDPGQAQKQFGTLASLEPFFSNIPGEAGEVPTQEQGLQAMFGDNAEAQTAITNAQARRKAQFGGGGGFDQSQKGGLTGL